MASSSRPQGGRRSIMGERDSDDPLAIMTAPPEGETPEEAEARIRREKAAIKRSEDIDREIAKESQAARKNKCVKILLLGQSESGKSTVLKNFQKKYDPVSFDRERAVWRSVCQLNVARSFGIILDVLNRHDNFFPHQLTPPTSPSDAGPSQDFSVQPTMELNSQSTTLTSEHRRIILRLAPLRQVEQALTQRFRPLPVSPPTSPLMSSRSQQELHVNGYAWQRAREKKREGSNDVETEDEGLARVLAACKDDMLALWSDPVVKNILKEYRIGLEELNSYFLDELSRIAVENYTPSDDDILRARLKTMGVTEHRFTLKQKLLDPKDLGVAELRIYDVGGARSQRSIWVPYFDDVNCIVFLAPMSAFDQTLAEARDVNRLEDSFKLWKDICASKLLSRASIVLLLNKRDILQKKLDAGTQFSRYVKSYTGLNKWEAVAKYLKSKFKATQREMSPEKRLFYAHITCATDVKQMSVILAAIEDLVLRRNLEQIHLL